MEVLTSRCLDVVPRVQDLLSKFDCDDNLIMITDRSIFDLGGTISVQAAPGNMQRKYLLICATTSSDVWVNFGSAATKGAPSIRIKGNTNFIMDRYVSPQSVWLIKDGTGAVDVVVKEA